MPQKLGEISGGNTSTSKSNRVLADSEPSKNQKKEKRGKKLSFRERLRSQKNRKRIEKKRMNSTTSKLSEVENPDKYVIMLLSQARSLSPDQVDELGDLLGWPKKCKRRRFCPPGTNSSSKKRSNLEVRVASVETAFVGLKHEFSTKQQDSSEFTTQDQEEEEEQISAFICKDLVNSLQSEITKQRAKRRWDAILSNPSSSNSNSKPSQDQRNIRKEVTSRSPEVELNPKQKKKREIGEDLKFKAWLTSKVSVGKKAKNARKTSISLNRSCFEDQIASLTTLEAEPSKNYKTWVSSEVRSIQKNKKMKKPSPYLEILRNESYQRQWAKHRHPNQKVNLTIGSRRSHVPESFFTTSKDKSNKKIRKIIAEHSSFHKMQEFSSAEPLQPPLEALNLKIPVSISGWKMPSTKPSKLTKHHKKKRESVREDKKRYKMNKTRLTCSDQKARAKLLKQADGALAAEHDTKLLQNQQKRRKKAMSRIRSMWSLKDSTSNQLLGLPSYHKRSIKDYGFKRSRTGKKVERN